VEFFVVVALIGIALLIAELLLPTGGLLAALGVAGLIVGGILALGSDSSARDWLGPALITLGLLSGISIYFITNKVLAAHSEPHVRTGFEELVGSEAEARTTLDPEGQVWSGGALWRARVPEGVPAPRPGDRVVVEAVEGLTLVVRPRSP
jgi:membrane-bound serine protease (ClpP class)